MPDNKAVPVGNPSKEDAGSEARLPVTEEELRAAFAKAAEKLGVPSTWPPRKVGRYC